MLAAILDALPIALGLILATLPNVAVPLILAARPGAQAVLGFLIGWVLGYLALGGGVIAFADLTAREPAAPAPWVVWARLLLGLALLLFGWLKWRNRPLPGMEAEMPGWMASVETINAPLAVVMGFLMVVLNPKNAVLIISGALSIAAASYVPAEQAVALLVFTAIASLAMAAPLVLRLTLGPAATDALIRLKAAFARHSRVVMSVVLLGLGLFVIANALADLLF